MIEYFVISHLVDSADTRVSVHPQDLYISLILRGGCISRDYKSLTLSVKCLLLYRSKVMVGHFLTMKVLNHLNTI